jgi:hypothetical protein
LRFSIDRNCAMAPLIHPFAAYRGKKAAGRGPIDRPAPAA